MFGFSKKKEVVAQQQVPQNAGQQQSTVVEDDMAKFEIPDFSDDDLNFDLGLGEFMPGATQNVPPAPAGLPTEPQEQQVPLPELETPQKEEVSVPVFEEKLPEAEEQKIPSFDNQNYNAQEDQETEPEPEPEEEEEETPEEPESAPQEIEVSLPKFNISPPVNVYSKVDVPEEKGKRSKTKQKIQESEEESFSESTPQKKPVQKSAEGLFVPNNTYKKIIILAEDISRKAEIGETAKKEYSLLMKNEKEIMAEADKDAQSIRDLIMSADAKLFGEW